MTNVFDENNVYFSNLRNVFPQGDTWAVLYPTDTNWNDHGVESYYDLLIKVNGATLNEEKRFTKILFLNETVSFHFVKSLQNQTPISQIQESFISQFNGLERFGEVIASIGKRNFILLLKLINDGSILKALRISPPYDFVNRMDYQVSLLRERGPYLAFYNGPGPLLNTFDDNIPRNLELSFTVPGQQIPLEISFSYNNENSIFKHRIVGLVGKNGVGKSQTLNAVINSVLPEEINETCSPQFNRVLVLSNTKHDPYPKNYPIGDFRNIFYLYTNLLEEQADNSLTQSFAQILRDNYHYNSKRKTDLFYEALVDIIRCDDLWIPIKNIPISEQDPFTNYRSFKRNFLPIHKEKDRIEFIKSIDTTSEIIFVKNSQPIILSTGQRFFSSIMLRLMSLVEKGTLLLFDEPETFLHPNLEVELIDYLYLLTEQLQSYAVISTHSIFVTRELPREQVRILDIENGLTRAVIPEFQTLGANLTSISNYIFGDISIRKSYQKRLDLLIKENVNTEDIINQHESELSDRAIMYLRNTRR